MKKNKLTLYQTLLGILMALVLCAGALIGMFFYNDYREMGYYNSARIYVSDTLAKINESFLNGGLKSEDYEPIENAKAVIVLADCTVIYSENDNYLVEKKVVLNELLQPDSADINTYKVSFAIEGENEVNGFAVFFIEKSAITGYDQNGLTLKFFTPVFISIAVCGALYLFNTLYLKRRVLAPVNEMLSSTRAIIDGNLSVPVVKNNGNNVYANDVEKLAYNFELMRIELEEQKERELSLRQSQKELISCISHDLKTPIATIRAYSEGLRDGMAKNPEQSQKYSDIIVEKTNILTKMITDLLDHSNAELNQLSIALKEQFFGEFIDSLAGELKGLCEHNDIGFSYENKIGNVLVSFDANRITQVVANLVDNAIKYARENGAEISLTVYEKNGCVVVSVKDNGIGIDASDIPFVFDKFYRGEKSRSTKIAGSGLGLSICKYIVEAHGGEMQFESLSGSGSEFFVSLPLK